MSLDVMKKFILILVCCLTGFVSAATWIGGTDPNLWNQPENWDKGVPASNNWAVIDQGFCNIDSSHFGNDAAECLRIVMKGNSSTQAHLLLDGGELYTFPTSSAYSCLFGDVADANVLFEVKDGYYKHITSSNILGRKGQGIWDISGGLVEINRIEIYGRGGETAPSKLNISGGTMIMDPPSTNYNANIGYGVSSIYNLAEAEINVSGGQLILERASIFLARDYAKATLNVSGGEVMLYNGALHLPKGGEGNTAIVNLTGGTVYASDGLEFGGGDKSLTMSKGSSLILGGDWVDRIESYINDGWFSIQDGRMFIGYDAGGDETAITVQDPDLAWAPDPLDMASYVDYQKQLSWSAGDSAASHDIYLGTDLEQVQMADNTLPVGISTYKGNLPLETTTYDPGDLILGQTYYWRVDEVNSDSTITVGPIWSFTVSPYLQVETFEGYNEPNEPAADTWIPSANASVLAEFEYPWQSVLMTYDNSASPFYSQIVRTFNPPLDVTAAGQAESLHIRAKGADSSSSLEPWYTTLTDTNTNSATVYYDGPAEDIAVRDRFSWDIDISDFSGVDVNEISTMAIGFGDKDNPAPGGSGSLYLDDIRVYPQRCIPSKVAGDIDGDCNVDSDELAQIIEDWLMVPTPQEPDSDGLVVHYSFDTQAGPAIPDDSGNGYDAATTDNAAHLDPSGGFDGNGCISFDGTFAIDIPEQLFSQVSSTGNLSISIWINSQQGTYNQENEKAGIIFQASQTEGSGAQVQFAAPGWNGLYHTVYWLAFSGGGISTGIAAQDYWEGWEHYVLVADYDNGVKRIFRNGTLVSDNVQYQPVEGLENGVVTVGSRTDLTDMYLGKMDELRIYNYGLSLDEAVWLSKQSAPYPSLFSPAEIDGDGVVTLKDFAEAAQNWMYGTILWP